MRNRWEAEHLELEAMTLYDSDSIKLFDYGSSFHLDDKVHDDATTNACELDWIPIKTQDLSPKRHNEMVLHPSDKY